MRRVALAAGAAGLLMVLTAAPASAGEGAPSISLVKTVGTVPDTCGTSDEITVEEGTSVYYCYTVTNTGNTLFNTHDLTDDQLGDLFTALDYDLAPGASTSYITDAVTLDQTTENCATWSAYNMSPPITAPPDDSTAVDLAITAPVEASDCATVTVTPKQESTSTESTTTTAAPSTSAKAKAAAAVPTYTG